MGGHERPHEVLCIGELYCRFSRAVADGYVYALYGGLFAFGGIASTEFSVQLAGHEFAAENGYRRAQDLAGFLHALYDYFGIVLEYEAHCVGELLDEFFLEIVGTENHGFDRI